MKNFLQLYALTMLALFTYSSESKAQTTITIDGNFSDWTSVPDKFTNPTGRGGSLKKIKTYAGTNDIFFYIEAAPTMGFSDFIMMINRDDNKLTGLNSGNYPDNSGAEILIESSGGVATGNIYHQYTGNGTSWEWGSQEAYNASSGQIKFSSAVDLIDKRAIEFSIKKTTLGTISNHISFAYFDNVNWSDIGTIPARVENSNPSLGFLRIETSEILPVKLETFEVKAEGNSAKLTWQTASEQNNNKFIIKRRGNEGSYIEVGSVIGKGTTNEISNYTFYDRNPLNGNNYYQLVQVDLDGKTNLVADKVINLTIASGNVSNVAPNPANDHTFVNFETGKYISLTLSSLEGKVLQKTDLRHANGSVKVDLSNLAQGVYYVKLVGKNESVAHKIVKK